MNQNSISRYALDALGEVANPLIRQALGSAWSESEAAVAQIESAFDRLTSGTLDAGGLNRFFNSWAQTNNSAAALAGFCNRLSKLGMHPGLPMVPPVDNNSLLDIIAHLNRVTDEDLGANGGMLHIDLYYRMATSLCGSDAWLSRQYTAPEALAFRQWKERLMLRNPDLINGLLVTLIHEVATHGEVEFILPLFEKWIAKNSGVSGREHLVWIRVHCGPTEKNHFVHSLQALDAYCRAFNCTLAQQPMETLFCTYLQKKADAMQAAAKSGLEAFAPPAGINAVHT
jgi:hypothetical protein